MIIVYLIVINIVAFAMYGIDKYKAVHNKWRIPESLLVGVSVIGGGVGALLGMLIWHHKTRKWKFKILVPLFLILWVLFTASLIYVETYYRADATALEGLKSDSEVTVTETDFGWFFDGPSETDALIFYPGGKVEETAYAPLSHKMAASGIDVCLVKMPLRLAILAPDKADDVMDRYKYDNWYIGGHSLGGVLAAYYTANHENKMDGLILLASYSTKKQSDNLKTILIRGSNDQVLKLKNFKKNRGNVPADSKELVIEGGTHAGFGSYGPQDGDGVATIPTSEQVDRTVGFIAGALK